MGLLISLWSAVAASGSVKTTRELHAASVRRSEFETHRDALSPLIRECKNLGAALSRSSDPTVPLEALETNFSAEFNRMSQVADDLTAALSEVDTAVLFGHGWASSVAVELGRHDDLFDLVCNRSRPEPARRSAAQQLAASFVHLTSLLQDKVRGEISQQIGRVRPRRWYFLWLR